MEKRYLNVSELAIYCSLSKETIYRYARYGYIPCFKLGKTLRFDKLAIDQWLTKFKRQDSNANLLQKS